MRNSILHHLKRKEKPAGELPKKKKPRKPRAPNGHHSVLSQIEQLEYQEHDDISPERRATPLGKKPSPISNGFKSYSIKKKDSERNIYQDQISPSVQPEAPRDYDSDL